MLYFNGINTNNFNQIIKTKEYDDKCLLLRYNISKFKRKNLQFLIRILYQKPNNFLDRTR